MSALTILLTAAIAFLALVDTVCLLLPGLFGRRERRDKTKFRFSGTRATSARWVCIVCLLTLATALVLTHNELNSGDSSRGARTSSSLCLALLLAFSVAVNSVALYFNFIRHRLNNTSRTGSLLPVTNLDTVYGVASLYTQWGADVQWRAAQAGSRATESGMSQSPPHAPLSCPYPQHFFSYLDSVKGTKFNEAENAAKGPYMEKLYLDRRDSDFMIRGTSPSRSSKSSWPDTIVVEQLEFPEPREQDEDLLDALMHDTVSILVDP